MLLEILISQIGTLIKYDDLTNFFNERQIKRIKKELTIEYTKYLGRKSFTTTSELYDIIASPQGKWLAVARFSDIVSILKKYDGTVQYKLINKLIAGEKITISLAPGAKLDSYQQVCHDYLMNEIYTSANIKAGLASCIFVMDTGYGKTYIALSLLTRLRGKTLVIVPNSNLVVDWKKAISNCYPNLVIGEYHCENKCDGDIVLMIIKSALHEEYHLGEKKIDYYNFFKRFDFVIFDEVHEYASPKYQRVFWRANRLTNLGITATPSERQDRMDSVYYKHLGPIIKAVDIPSFGLAPINWKCKVRIIYYHGPPEFTKKITGAIGNDTCATNKMLAQDPYRNKLILDIILDMYSRKRFTFVFAEHCDILHRIARELKESKVPCAADSADGALEFMGGASEADREIAEKSANIILTTLAFCSRGISIIKMDSLFMASPRRHGMKQLLGRIFRRGGNANIVREIIDLVDVDNPIGSQFTDREKYYDACGYEKEFTEVNYQDITPNISF